jgi:hypothetical protein
MSKIKEHHHEEISRGLHGGDEDYCYEEYKRERESVRATLERKGAEPRRIGEIIAEMYPAFAAEEAAKAAEEFVTAAQIADWEERRANNEHPEWLICSN